MSAFEITLYPVLITRWTNIGERAINFQEYSRINIFSHLHKVHCRMNGSLSLLVTVSPLTVASKDTITVSVEWRRHISIHRPGQKIAVVTVHWPELTTWLQRQCNGLEIKRKTYNVILCDYFLCNPVSSLCYIETHTQRNIFHHHYPHELSSLISKKKHKKGT
jgi:hypothetical protein